MAYIRARIQKTRTAGILVAMLVAAFAATTVVVLAQPKGQEKPRKLDKGQQQDVNALIKVVDAQTSGTPPASDLKLEMRPDFLKALEGRTYVPFTLTLDPSLSGTSVAIYLRVVDKKAPPPAPKAKPAAPRPPGEEQYSDKPDEEPTAIKYTFEDAHFLQVKGEGGAAPRVHRAFAVPAGEYDVYVAVKPRGNTGKEAPKTGVLKQTVSVPDFWTSQLATSSVILAARVEPVKEQVSQELQAERPYMLGTTEIVPADDAIFQKKEELSVIFLIYNPGIDATKHPDVAVEYSFHQKTGEAEKYFNKTSPQKFDATTLPAQFDMAAGHQLVAGQSVPLTSFPEGDYRLEIKVNDNITKQTLTKNVNFTVQGS